MPILKNAAHFDGKYGTIDTFADSWVEVQILNATFEKTANPMVWINGELTYTVTLDNGEDPDDPASLPLTDLEFTDTINISLAQLNVNSVVVNGDPKTINTDFTYDQATGKLVIPLEDIAPGGTTVISFRVVQV